MNEEEEQRRLYLNPPKKETRRVEMIFFFLKKFFFHHLSFPSLKIITKNERVRKQIKSKKDLKCNSSRKNSFIQKVYKLNKEFIFYIIKLKRKREQVKQSIRVFEV